VDAVEKQQNATEKKLETIILAESEPLQIAKGPDPQKVESEVRKIVGDTSIPPKNPEAGGLIKEILDQFAGDYRFRTIEGLSTKLHTRTVQSASSWKALNKMDWYENSSIPKKRSFGGSPL
jgi:hypothetical protein